MKTFLSPRYWVICSPEASPLGSKVVLGLIVLSAVASAVLFYRVKRRGAFTARSIGNPSLCSLMRYSCFNTVFQYGKYSLLFFQIPVHEIGHFRRHPVFFHRKRSDEDTGAYGEAQAGAREVRHISLKVCKAVPQVGRIGSLPPLASLRSGHLQPEGT